MWYFLQLSSINNFVDNIDNHLKQRHEELALFQCAQRIEGFDMMEGMSEEIDKVNEWNKT